MSNIQKYLESVVAEQQVQAGEDAAYAALPTEQLMKLAGIVPKGWKKEYFEKDAKMARYLSDLVKNRKGVGIELAYKKVGKDRGTEIAKVVSKGISPERKSHLISSARKITKELNLGEPAYKSEARKYVPVAKKSRSGSAVIKNASAADDLRKVLPFVEDVGELGIRQFMQKQRDEKQKKASADIMDQQKAVLKGVGRQAKRTGLSMLTGGGMGGGTPARLVKAAANPITEVLVDPGLQKVAKDMPHFTDQDRPAKVKEIYRALKREHPSMPAEMKARIAARQGKKGKQHQGPPYKGPLTKSKKAEAEKQAIGLSMLGKLPGLGARTATTVGSAAKAARPMATAAQKAAPMMRGVGGGALSPKELAAGQGLGQKMMGGVKSMLGGAKAPTPMAVPKMAAANGLAIELRKLGSAPANELATLMEKLSISNLEDFKKVAFVTKEALSPELLHAIAALSGGGAALGGGVGALSAPEGERLRRGLVGAGIGALGAPIGAIGGFAGTVKAREALGLAKHLPLRAPGRLGNVLKELAYGLGGGAAGATALPIAGGIAAGRMGVNKDADKEVTSGAKLILQKVAKLGVIDLTKDDLQSAIEEAREREDIPGRAKRWGVGGGVMGGIAGTGVGAGIGRLLQSKVGPWGYAAAPALGAAGALAGRGLGVEHGAEEALADRLVAIARQRVAEQRGVGEGLELGQGFPQGG